MWHKRHALPKRHNKSLTFALPARPPPSCRTQESQRGEGNDSTFLCLPRPAGVRPRLSSGTRASFSGFRALFSTFGFYAYCLWPPFSLSSEAPERWPSGRRRSPAKGVEVKSFSWVRIPSSPPSLHDERSRFPGFPSDPLNDSPEDAFCVRHACPSRGRTIAPSPNRTDSASPAAFPLSCSAARRRRGIANDKATCPSNCVRTSAREGCI